jgi:hypothetical protein
MKARWAAVLAGAIASFASSPALEAHHGAAVYDLQKSITVTGTVTKFMFINPHVLIYVEVKGDDGSVVEWSGELTSPIRLSRGAAQGVKWTKDILKPGDKVSLTGSPARNGAPVLVLTRVVDASGRVLVGAAG